MGGEPLSSTAENGAWARGTAQALAVYTVWPWATYGDGKSRES
jgi:hypothetical protein